MNRKLLVAAVTLATVGLVAAVWWYRTNPKPAPCRRVVVPQPLLVGMTDVGRGVFAQRDFAKGEVVETCPLLIKPTGEWGDATADYVFQYDDNDKTRALALGLCSLYNHADKPNLAYETDDQANTMVTRAARDIKSGEELRISYGKTWFKNRDHIEKKM